MAADTETIHELMLLRHSVDAIRQAVNLELDGLAAKLDAILPTPEPLPPRRGKKQWKGYLDD